MCVWSKVVVLQDLSGCGSRTYVLQAVPVGTAHWWVQRSQQDRGQLCGHVVSSSNLFLILTSLLFVRFLHLCSYRHYLFYMVPISVRRSQSSPHCKEHSEIIDGVDDDDDSDVILVVLMILTVIVTVMRMWCTVRMTTCKALPSSPRWSWWPARAVWYSVSSRKRRPQHRPRHSRCWVTCVELITSTTGWACSWIYCLMAQYDATILTQCSKLTWRHRWSV